MMKTAMITAGVALAGCMTAQADPVWPRIEGGMEHVLVELDGSGAIHAEVEHGDTALPLRDFGETHNPPADVLDGMSYNDQFGWLQNGFITLDPGESIWIEQTGATPGLEVYEGGMRMMREMHSYTPIFGTDGSTPRWEWGLTMTHNWYAAAAPGDYSATYRVYVGDATGTPVAGYTDDTVTLNWTAVPEPGAAALLLCGTLLLAGRRR